MYNKVLTTADPPVSEECNRSWLLVPPVNGPFRVAVSQAVVHIKVIHFIQYTVM